MARATLTFDNCINQWTGKSKVGICSKWASLHGMNRINCRNGNNSTSFWQVFLVSSKDFIVLHTKRDRSSSVKKSLKEKLKSCILSHFCIPDQSLHEVGVIVRLLISESYRNCWTHPPKFWCRKRCRGGSFRYGFKRRQAFHLKRTNTFRSFPVISHTLTLHIQFTWSSVLGTDGTVRATGNPK